MKQRSLRIAIVTLCAMTVPVAVCRAQVDDPAAAASTSGAASGQDAGSSADGAQPASAYGTQAATADGAQPAPADAEAPVAAAPAGASSWTAGAASFKLSNDASWGGKDADFRTDDAKSWTAESGNFAEPVQPAGIWHEKAPPLPAVMPSAVASLRTSPAAGLAFRPGGAHPVIPGGRRSKSVHRRARHQYGTPLTGRTQDTNPPAHHLGAESGDSSGFTPGAGLSPR